MDINNLGISAPRTENPGSSKAGKASVPTNTHSHSAAAPADESVTLTQTAKMISAAREGASEVPFDSAKVAQIKAALTEGQYPIDNERLAGNMLNLEKLLA